MITKQQADEFAKAWITSWNSHNIKTILEHYTEDLEITTPMLKLAAGIEKSSLKGKEAVAAYWTKALERVPDLYFELIDVTVCVDSVALYYKSIMNKKAIEVMFFNAEGKVNKMFAYYT